MSDADLDRHNRAPPVRPVRRRDDAHRLTTAEEEDAVAKRYQDAVKGVRLVNDERAPIDAPRRRKVDLPPTKPFEQDEWLAPSRPRLLARWWQALTGWLRK